jgi:hypothetical protein
MAHAVCSVLHRDGASRLTPRPDLSQEDILNKISADLENLIVDMNDLHLDEENCRKHDNFNILTIASSLELFGQQTPIKIDEHGIILKGNGTYLAAQSLGWNKIAASKYDSKEDGALYAITDNKAGDLADWHYEMLKLKFDELKVRYDLKKVGWTENQITMIGAADWAPHKISVDDAVGKDIPEALVLTRSEREIVDRAITSYRSHNSDNESGDGLVLAAICEKYSSEVSQ